MADANKVKFGLKNLYYAKATVTGNTVTYATPVAIPGAVSLTLDAQGEETNFYADDTKFYNTTNNTGYAGDLEVAKLPDVFFADIFGYAADTDGAIFEDAEIEPAQFALLFEISGDANKKRGVLYLCTASRPSVGSGTLTESKDPVTETISINASPLPADANGTRYVKSSCVEGDTCYAGWFSAVHMHA